MKWWRVLTCVSLAHMAFYAFTGMTITAPVEHPIQGILLAVLHLLPAVIWFCKEIDG